MFMSEAFRFLLLLAHIRYLKRLINFYLAQGKYAPVASIKLIRQDLDQLAVEVGLRMVGEIQ